MTAPARALCGVIMTYQRLHAGRLSPCRFVPTCSSYALEAIDVHGAARGGWLAVRRLGRCQPFGGRGWDPVPTRRSNDWPPRSPAALPADNGPVENGLVAPESKVT